MKLFEVTNTTCMRKSANRNAQISVIHSAHCPDLCFAICRFSHAGCVCHLEQLHAQSPFLFPIVFSISLISFFDICSVLSNFFNTVLSPGLFGCCFTWAAARLQQLLFVVLAAGFGVSLRDATSNLPSSPNLGIDTICFFFFQHIMLFIMLFFFFFAQIKLKNMLFALHYANLF